MLTFAPAASSLALCAVVLASFAPAQPQPTYHSVDDAARDPAVSTLAGGFLTVPGIATDFVRSGGGQFVELPNGTARLTCRVFSQSNLYAAMLVDLTFTGRIAPGAVNHPPPGAPLQQLLPNAYVPLGPVDPNTFVYYANATGTLTGVRNLAGLTLQVTATQPVQIGAGANNRNLAPGLLGIFQVTVHQASPGGLTPNGDAKLLVDLVPPYAEATTHPQPDTTVTNLPAGRALVLPGIGDDYVFAPSAQFVEQHDGQATLSGRLVRLSQIDDGFDLTLQLAGRVDPGEALHPPAGSPVLQLSPSAYVGSGGPVDPAHWHYYTVANGTLLGTGINTGAHVDLAAVHAVQLGGGANQANTYFGLFGAFTVNVVAHPPNRVLAPSGPAELCALTAVFPVLPFPQLTVPPVPLSLPTLSAQGLTLTGANLLWTEYVALGNDLIGAGGAFPDGWFRVLDNQTLEFHPRPGAVPGVYSLVVLNPAIQSNSLPVDLVAPSAPAMVAESSVATSGTAHVLMHSGPVLGPTVSIVVASSMLGPSVAPGVASLTIGNNFTDLALDANVYLHDPATGIAGAFYGPIPPSLQGLTYWFQALVLDLSMPALPLPATNHWRIDF